MWLLFCQARTTAAEVDGKGIKLHQGTIQPSLTQASWHITKYSKHLPPVSYGIWDLTIVALIH